MSHKAPKVTKSSRFYCPCAALIGACVLLLQAFPSFAGRYNDVISIGDPMPGFEKLPSVSGKKVSADEIDSDVLVLISLANSCPFSLGAEKDLIALVDSVKNKSVRILAIGINDNSIDDLPAMKERAKSAGFNFDYLRDESQALGRKLGATVTPEFFVFDKQRKLVYTGLLHNSPAMGYGDAPASYLKGEPTEFYVRDAINSALAGEPVALAETAPFGCTVQYSTED